MSQEQDSPRSGGLVSSQGIEGSFVWLAIGIVGMVFLLFSFLGSRADNKTPTYDRDSQITPRDSRGPEETEGQPEVGVPENTEST
jgi:hypothetical protein